MLLYPASPEAVFRYAQEILVPQRQWDVATELMDYTDRIDPNNKRTETFRSSVDRLRHIVEEVDALEAKRRKGPALSKMDAYVLAQDYYALGRTMEAAQTVRGFLPEATQPEELKLLSTLLLAAHLDADAETALKKLLAREPTAAADPWLDLAKLQQKTGRRRDALDSFRKAAQIDYNRVTERLRREDELMEIARPLLQPRRP